MDRQNGEGAPIEKPKMAKRTSVQPWNAPKKSSPARTPQQATAVKQSVMAHSPLASNANAARSKALADNDRVKALQAEWEEKEGAAKEKVAAERKKLADLEEKKRAQELERQAKTKAWNEELSKSQAEAQKQKLAKSRAEAQKRKQPQTDFQRAQNHYPSSVSEWSGVSSSEEEESEEEDDDGDDASDVGQAVFKPVTSSTPLPSQKTAAASPIPLPSYAQNLSHKRSLAEMSNGDSSSEPPQKLTEKKTSPRPEPVTTEMPKSLAADTAAKPPASTAPTPAVEKLADTDLPALIRSDVGTATSASSSPAPLPTKVDLHVYVNGEKLDVLDKVEDGSRMYTQYFNRQGKLEPSRAVPIPTGYALYGDETEAAPYICPVRECQKRMDTMKGFGGHFSSAHSRFAYNDNLDGTIMPIGLYTANGWRHSPAVIVSRNPLPLDFPPPMPSWTSLPTPSVRVPVTTFDTRASSSKASHKTADKGDVDRDPVAYLNSVLDHRQVLLEVREDIDYLSKLPLRRRLPDAWVKRHKAGVDTQHWACGLAYITGDEVEPPLKCNEFDRFSELAQKAFRLSERCIKLPEDMPQTAKDHFFRGPTCVGCRYWAHLQRRGNPCQWLREATGKMNGQSPTGYKLKTSVSSSVEPSALREPLASVGATPPVPTRPRVGGRRSTGDVPMQDFDASVAGSGAAAGEDEGVSAMEDWEFAPGKVLDKKETQTLAFSTSYLTSSQPVTIADGIGINRFHLAAGATHKWAGDKAKLRYCEVIKGKVDIRMGGQSLSVGQGGVFVIRPSASCVAENRRYVEVVLSCHTIHNYSLVGDN